MNRAAILCSLCILLAIGCGGDGQHDVDTPSSGATPKPENAPRVTSVLTADLGDSVRVQDDLYLHVNGEWLSSTEIPADKSNYGLVESLRDQSRNRLREIIEGAASAGDPSDPDVRKIADFYASYMNEELIESLDLSPLEPKLAKIDRLENKAEVIQYFGYLQQIGVDTPIRLPLGRAEGMRSWVVTVIQGGTSLPDRDYYLREDSSAAQVRTALANYIDELLGSSGEIEVTAVGERIVALETRLAKLQSSNTELRNLHEVVQDYDVSDLAGQLPGLDWKGFFAGAGLPELDFAAVVPKAYFKGLGDVVRETDVSVWRGYLKFKLLDAYASVLPKRYADAHFTLYQRVLKGVPEQEPRWRRGVAATAGGLVFEFGVLGDAVGRLYTQRYFGPEQKQAAEQIASNVRAAFRESIDELTWLEPETKGRVHEKLDRLKVKIGYPDKWRDYSGLEIRDDELIGNLMRSARFEYVRAVRELDDPDDDQWMMTPQTVSAYFDPGLNEIVLPAAVFMPPLFDVAADDAANYGAIGATIAHEISHAFDENGSQFDAFGFAESIWTNEDHAAFKRITGRLVAQFNACEPLPGRHVDGKLTLNENIADLAGLAIAHKAYRLSLAGQKSPFVDGRTGDQRFFLAWARMCRQKYREEDLVKRLLTDFHAPAQCRCNGAVTNIDAFYKAFDVKPGDKLFKPESERIRIW